MFWPFYAYIIYGGNYGKDEKKSFSPDNYQKRWEGGGQEEAFFFYKTLKLLLKNHKKLTKNMRRKNMMFFNLNVRTGLEFY